MAEYPEIPTLATPEKLNDHDTSNLSYLPRLTRR